MAQPGRAQRSGRWGRWFKSSLPDQFFAKNKTLFYAAPKSASVWRFFSGLFVSARLAFNGGDFGSSDKKLDHPVEGMLLGDCAGRQAHLLILDCGMEIDEKKDIFPAPSKSGRSQARPGNNQKKFMIDIDIDSNALYTIALC